MSVPRTSLPQTAGGGDAARATKPCSRLTSYWKVPNEYASSMERWACPCSSMVTLEPSCVSWSATLAGAYPGVDAHDLPSRKARALLIRTL